MCGMFNHGISAKVIAKKYKRHIANVYLIKNKFFNKKIIKINKTITKTVSTTIYSIKER